MNTFTITDARLQSHWSHATLEGSGAPPTGESFQLHLTLVGPTGATRTVRLDSGPPAQPTNHAWVDSAQLCAAYAMVRAGLAAGTLHASVVSSHDGPEPPLLALVIDTRPDEPSPPAETSIPHVNDSDNIEHGQWQPDRYIVRLSRSSTEAQFSAVLAVSGRCTDVVSDGSEPPFGHTDRMTLYLGTDEGAGDRGSWVGDQGGQIHLVHQVGSTLLTALLASRREANRNTGDQHDTTPFTAYTRWNREERRGRLLYASLGA
jgi:hypothetical protein